MGDIGFRYIVDNVDEAVEFYSSQLGFQVKMQPGPGFAMLQRGSLRLFLNTPGGGGGAGQALSDGSVPAPGGWNRIQLIVDDLEQTAAGMREAGVRFRGELITGRGGNQLLAEDPSGNLVELFEPLAR